MNYIFEKDRIYVNDEEGKMVAEIVFPAISDRVVNIKHTYVDESLRGKSVAGGLMTLLAEKLRGENKKAYPTCSYAVHWFEKHPSYADVYADKP